MSPDDNSVWEASTVGGVSIDVIAIPYDRCRQSAYRPTRVQPARVCIQCSDSSTHVFSVRPERVQCECRRHFALAAISLTQHPNRRDRDAYPENRPSVSRELGSSIPLSWMIPC